MGGICYIRLFRDIYSIAVVIHIRTASYAVLRVSAAWHNRINNLTFRIARCV